MPGMIYAVISYLVFLTSFLWAVCFVGDFLVPKTINSGVPSPVVPSLVINVLLLGLFAVQHSVMARPGFKATWTRVIPASMERSTYVLLASVILLLLFGLWQPLPAVVWSIDSEWARMVVRGVFWAGWLIVLLSTFMIDHFDLFGLRQAYLQLVGSPYTRVLFTERWLYGLVRHPIMLGFLIAFWATPTMTQGHLLFAIACTGYIFGGLWFEERDLLAHHGAEFESYRRRVPMIVPGIRKR
jgi:protein-S-isoprenylcysteine O-methyltransferase Ste14